MGQASHGLGRYAEAVEALRATVRALPGDLSRETYGLSAPPAVIARTWLAWCLAERGKFAEGERHAEEGRAIAEQMNQKLRHALHGHAGVVALVTQRVHARPEIRRRGQP